MLRLLKAKVAKYPDRCRSGGWLGRGVRDLLAESTFGVILPSLTLRVKSLTVGCENTRGDLLTGKSYSRYQVDAKVRATEGRRTVCGARREGSFRVIPDQSCSQ